jgi:hypothetical protein
MKNSGAYPCQRKLVPNGENMLWCSNCGPYSDVLHQGHENIQYIMQYGSGPVQWIIIDCGRNDVQF